MTGCLSLVPLVSFRIKAISFQTIISLPPDTRHRLCVLMLPIKIHSSISGSCLHIMDSYFAFSSRPAVHLVLIVNITIDFKTDCRTEDLSVTPQPIKSEIKVTKTFVQVKFRNPCKL